MRSVMLTTLLLGCGACGVGATAASLPPDIAARTVPGCLAHDGSLQMCTALNETLRSFTFENEVDLTDLIEIPVSLEPVSQRADVVTNKQWIRGTEPPAVVLAVSGFAFIALSKLRRRLSGVIPHSHLHRRRDYTIRQMA